MGLSKSLTFFAPGVLLLLGFHPAWGVSANQPGLVSSEYIFETAPFPSCHASTLAESKSGLLAAWFGGTYERHPDVGIWVSHYQQGKWSPPVEVANGVQSPEVRYPTWNPVLFQPSQGPLMLFYKVGPSPSEWWGMVTTSDDGGHTWTTPRRLPDGILGPIKNKPIELADGTILSGSSTEHDGWRVHFEISHDRGETWSASPPVNDGKKILAIQPSILRYADGRLQALGRTRASGIFQIWSADNGQTWGEMSLTGLPNPSSGTDAVTLSDGRQFLVYNHNPNYKGRSPLNVAVSTDGEQWQAALVLEDEPLHQYSYPAVIQTRDGLVHVSYTWRRERIKHVVIDPRLLRPQPMIDNAWPAEVGGGQ
jgi:predicted neuraminidase